MFEFISCSPCDLEQVTEPLCDLEQLQNLSVLLFFPSAKWG